jgi:hypothetical protein
MDDRDKADPEDLDYLKFNKKLGLDMEDTVSMIIQAPEKKTKRLHVT